MEANNQVKQCQFCNKTIRGRADKKFCDDNCRNSFNNQLKAPENNYIRNINNALLKNRRILSELLSLEEEMIKVQKDKLIQKGFSFKYFTHNYINKKGNSYFFCYDFGYLSLENDWILIVKRRDNQ